MSGKENESTLMALRRFLKELVIAPFGSKFSIMVAIAVFSCVSYHLAKSLSSTMSQSFLPVWACVISGLIVTWLIAFVWGVKTRPIPYIPEFPHLKLMGKVTILVVPLVLVSSITLGVLSKITIIRSLVYAVIGWIATVFIRSSWFSLSTLKTSAVLQMFPERSSREIVESDTFRGMWAFSWVAVLAIHLILLGFGGNLVILNSSLITAIFATGYASGYIP